MRNKKPIQAVSDNLSSRAFLRLCENISLDADFTEAARTVLFTVDLLHFQANRLLVDIKTLNQNVADFSNRTFENAIEKATNNSNNMFAFDLIEEAEKLGIDHTVPPPSSKQCDPVSLLLPKVPSFSDEPNVEVLDDDDFIAVLQEQEAPEVRSFSKELQDLIKINSRRNSLKRKSRNSVPRSKVVRLDETVDFIREYTEETSYAEQTVPTQVNQDETIPNFEHCAESTMIEYINPPSPIQIEVPMVEIPMNLSRLYSCNNVERSKRLRKRGASEASSDIPSKKIKMEVPKVNTKGQLLSKIKASENIKKSKVFGNEFTKYLSLDIKNLLKRNVKKRHNIDDQDLLRMFPICTTVEHQTDSTIIESEPDLLINQGANNLEQGENVLESALEPEPVVYTNNSNVKDKVIKEIMQNTSLEITENVTFVIENLVEYWKNKASVNNFYKKMDRITKARTFSTLLNFYKHSIIRFEKCENNQVKEILVGPKIEYVSQWFFNN